MKSFIKRASAFTFICMKCKDEIVKKTGRQEMYCENMYSHVQSPSHLAQTPDRELEKLTVVIKLIKEKEAKRRRAKFFKKACKQDNNEAYLEFIAFCVTLRLSYTQISQMGTFLQKLMRCEKSGFFSTHYFDEEVISRVVRDCYRPYFLDELHQNLASSKFSFSIDTSSMAGESLCAIKVRYLQEDPQGDRQLRDELVSITTMKDTSTAPTMLGIVNSKLLINGEIQNNLVGLTHDNAEALASTGEGLPGLLNAQLHRDLFDLPDPCHGLNLALEHSLDSLPKGTMNFVEKIHNYFVYPQRRASFKLFQEKKNLNPLLLCHYADTRWLSLSQSLNRLLEVWELLEEHLGVVVEQKRCYQKVRVRKFLNQLKDPYLKLQIRVLKYVVDKISELNEALQNPGFDISTLESEMKFCFISVADLACSLGKLEQSNFEDLITLDWTSDAIQKDWFISDQEFITKLVTKVHSSFIILPQAEETIITSFPKNMKTFIASLLGLLIEYLPFKDEALSFVDFLQLNADTDTLQKRMLKFNEKFHVVPDNELKTRCFPEILRLKTLGIFSYRTSPKDTISQIWSRINKSGQFPHLSKLAYFINALPVSSSDVEQAFSAIKLFKTNQRNALSEESVEGSLLIHQKYINKEYIEVPEQVVANYVKLKEELNRRKSKNRPVIRTASQRAEEEAQNNAQLNTQSITSSQMEEESKNNEQANSRQASSSTAPLKKTKLNSQQQASATQDLLLTQQEMEVEPGKKEAITKPIEIGSLRKRTEDPKQDMIDEEAPARKKAVENPKKTEKSEPDRTNDLATSDEDASIEEPVKTPKAKKGKNSSKKKKGKQQ